MQLISVLMSVYNEKLSWIEEAIDSILNQTYPNFEFIIVIDNPNLSKDVVNFLRELETKEKRIKLIFNEQNMGLAQSMNIALKHASGEYIARMDADDISVEKRFEKEISLIEQYHVDVVSSAQIDIDENGNEVSRRGFTRNPRQVKRWLKFTNFIGHSTVMIKADALRKVGGYRNFKVAQDYDLWLRMLSEGYQFYITGDYLIRYRRRESGITQKHRMDQYYTLIYQRQLDKERRNKGFDNFSLDNYDRFLQEKIETIGENRFKSAKQEFDQAIHYMKNKSLKGAIHLIKAVYILPTYVFERTRSLLIRSFIN